MSSHDREIDTERTAISDTHRPAAHPEDGDDLADALQKAKVAAALFGNAPLALKVGRFTVLDRIGAGGMGEVFSAYDDQLDRKVAIKLVRPDTASPRAERRLLAEARAVAKLSHPNVVQVYEAGPFGDRVFIAMEFIAGQPLHAWATSDMPWRDKLTAIDGTARGLAAAHAAGLLHRDIKPSNILVGEDGRVAIIDFGLAQAGTSDGEDSAGDRSSQAFGGTPAYMAPEQAKFGGSEHSDQFSLCVTAYEVLYGQQPFANDRLPCWGHDAEPVLPRGDVPPWVGQVLLRGLSLDPAARFESVEALRVALQRDPVRRRKRILGRASLIAGGLMVGIASVFGVQQSDRGPLRRFGHGPVRGLVRGRSSPASETNHLHEAILRRDRLALRRGRPWRLRAAMVERPSRRPAKRPMWTARNRQRNWTAASRASSTGGARFGR